MVMGVARNDMPIRFETKKMIYTYNIYIILNSLNIPGGLLFESVTGICLIIVEEDIVLNKRFFLGFSFMIISIFNLITHILPHILTPSLSLARHTPAIWSLLFTQNLLCLKIVDLIQFAQNNSKRSGDKETCCS